MQHFPGPNYYHDYAPTFHHYHPQPRPQPHYIHCTPEVHNVIEVIPPPVIVRVVEKRRQTAKDLLDLICRALTDMGGIASEDNPEIGARIIAKLNIEKDTATLIYAEWKDGVNYRSRRFKRQAAGEDRVKNELGDLLTKAGDVIESDKEKLSPAAQDKIDSRHERAVDDCQADVCKSHAAKRNRIKEAKAARKG